MRRVPPLRIFGLGPESFFRLCARRKMNFPLPCGQVLGSNEEKFVGEYGVKLSFSRVRRNILQSASIPKKYRYFSYYEVPNKKVPNKPESENKNIGSSLLLHARKAHRARGPACSEGAWVLTAYRRRSNNSSNWRHEHWEFMLGASLAYAQVWSCQNSQCSCRQFEELLLLSRYAVDLGPITGIYRYLPVIQ